MKTLERVLIANRGEIALRIMRTCRRMGLSTVAVFSEADAKSPHVAFADDAVCIGPPAARESYLNAEAILRAAKLTGADCVHPGYGFLSENPDFAQTVIDAGLTFIGPSPAAIRSMGLKREAKALVSARGVPVVPGFDGGDQSTEQLIAKAKELGFPLIFKPSAGGGGKGMKIVRQASELNDAIDSARREATNAFGDPTLIIERYLERPRHIELQLLGDTHGTVVHLFERECSLQRRHQKVVEETPSVALTPELRAQMGEAAVEVAKAIGYTNAGTVELMLDGDQRFYFSEMNTRLQVEHRVTELVVDLDLVEQQVRIARGERLGFTQQDLRQRGHAVQVRLYAEDPSTGFLPSTGTLHDFHVHEVGDVLVDAGVATGVEVSPHYDPMLAKLIAWGETRAEAIGKLRRALRGVSVHGVTTNAAYLERLLGHPRVQAGELHTGLIEETAAEFTATAPVGVLPAVAATLADFAERRAKNSYLPGVVSGFRNNRFSDQREHFEGVSVGYRDLGGDRVEIDGAKWKILSWSAPVLELEDPHGLRQRARVTSAGDRVFVHTREGNHELRRVPRFPPPRDAATTGGFMAPMPGKVVKVSVAPGDRVTAGQVMLVLEAMKMEQATRSPTAGVIRSVLVREGDQVTAGQVLVTLEP